MSSNNGLINWKDAADDGVESAYIRSSMGGAGVDTALAKNANGALVWGVKFGFYHLFRADAPGLKQAVHALETVESYDADYPIAVDVEAALGDIQVSPDVYAQQLQSFVQKIRDVTGAFPVIYTGYGAWTALVKSSPYYNQFFAQCPLWVAHYTHLPKPLLPPPWTTYWLWQYSSTHAVEWTQNRRVDVNRRH